MERSIIKPILKLGKDHKLPLSYRGIPLMSTVAKLFISIINSSLNKFSEDTKKR